MNMTNTYASPAETRTIEESLSAAAEAMGRAEYMLERLHYAVTGYEPPPAQASAGVGALGIMHDADRLASRLEAFCADLERTSARVAAGNVQSLAKGSHGAQSMVAQSEIAARLG